jgi:hypothetical protein
MDLDPTHRERIKAEIKRIFAWLRAPSCKHDKNEGDPTLGLGLGLKNTPIILLSSLAPGADQWVVETAQEMDPPLCVLAPLPFLKDQYLEASTFKRDGITKDEAASEFLAAFPDEDVFVVRLLDEIDLNDDALRAKHKSILTGPAGQEERDRRYAAAGEYVAAYGNLLIALTDRPIGQTENAFVHPGEGPGAQAVAELKRRGMTPGLLPDLPALSWADDGPVIHVYAPRRPIEVPGSAESKVIWKPKQWNCSILTTAGRLTLAKARMIILTGTKPVTPSSKSSPSIWSDSIPKKFALTRLGKKKRSPKCYPGLPIRREKYGATR